MTIEQILPILAALLFSLLEVTEGAKGSLRAGVMSRTNMRRKHPKYYDNGGWDGNGELTAGDRTGGWIVFVVIRPWLWLLREEGG